MIDDRGDSVACAVAAASMARPFSVTDDGDIHAEILTKYGEMILLERLVDGGVEVKFPMTNDHFQQI
jgi:hypothetical protein